jgi:hypothetical protein
VQKDFLLPVKQKNQFIIIIIIITPIMQQQLSIWKTDYESIIYYIFKTHVLPFENRGFKSGIVRRYKNMPEICIQTKIGHTFKFTPRKDCLVYNHEGVFIIYLRDNIISPTIDKAFASYVISIDGVLFNKRVFKIEDNALTLT